MPFVCFGIKKYLHLYAYPKHWAVLVKHKDTAVHASVDPPVDGTDLHLPGICTTANPEEAILTLVTGKSNAWYLVVFCCSTRLMELPYGCRVPDPLYRITKVLSAF